jgi:L-ascorbate metabolism protein UlaG (beta-lactamase superfamily)
MKKPLLQDNAFLLDVQKAKHSSGPDGTDFHLWWLGQSGFLLQWREKHLLFDPYLSDSLTKKYAATDKPHVRMTERVVSPDKLSFVDVVTSSHNHTDHLDAETLIPLLNSNPKLTLIIPEANREFVADRLGISTDLPIGLDAGRHVHFHGWDIHGVPAAHEKVEHDEDGRCKFLGYVVEFGPWVIYQSGDTVRYPKMAEILRQWNIDVALLPINGANPERRVAGNLSGLEAAELAHDINARIVIPCHYDMFEFNTADPVEFSQACEASGVNYRILQQGERWSSSTLPRQK